MLSYRKIYVPVDNSPHSDAAANLAISLAGRAKATVAGSHVYAAKLHNVRFMQMEFTLPDEYKEETELDKQRRIHDALIARGLKLISDSYLDHWEEEASAADIAFDRRLIDGRNFEGLVEDLDSGDYDLLVIGALGTGAVKHSTVGSVTERVIRRSEIDALVVRTPENWQLEGDGPIVVAFDGSEWSWGALKSACALATLSNRSVEVVVAIEADDPAEALLDAHLRLARKRARHWGVSVQTTVLDGAASEVLNKHLEDSGAWLVVLGRHGSDVDDGETEPGSLIDHIMRYGPCNTLIVNSTYRPNSTLSADSNNLQVV